MSIFKRYDPDAKLTVYYAALIAAHANVQKIGTNELLIALTWRQHAPDCAFRKLKDDFADIWSAAGFPHFPVSAVPYKPAKVPLNDQAKQTLAIAAREADRMGDYWIDIDHFMLGILLQDTVSSQILRDAGWSIDSVIAAGENGRKKYPPKPVPWLSQMLWKYRLFFGSRR
jgi:hypothetical protein